MYRNMKKVFYLGTCSTCTKIINTFQLAKGFEMKEIKSDPITAEELEAMKALAGSYEALFSRRAMKYRQWGLNDRKLTEADYRELILKEYTFLKRPVIVWDDRIFIGSAKNNLTALEAALYNG